MNNFITNYERTFNIMCAHLEKYVLENKLNSAILGISGGIDSTVVAYILRQVEHNLQKLNYSFRPICISLPTNTTQDEEFKVACLVGETLSNFRIENIDSISKFVSDLLFAINSKNDKIRWGNVKSRLRTIILYDLAKVNNGFVIGTDNKTEYLLGFSTIGGDGLYDYCPIQNLWKTEVYGLAEFLKQKFIDEGDNNAAFAIGESIKLTPQDGLGISSSDMEQIGARSYVEVDHILKVYLEEDNKGYCTFMDPVIFDKVIDRYKKNKFKQFLPVCVDRKYYE